MSGRAATLSTSADPVIRSPEGPEHEAFINLVLTATTLVQEVADTVKPRGLTEPQFNALRILRGAGKDGLPCSGVAERMITRVPDITRLVDRLERMGFAERRRDLTADRRVVKVAISPQGRALLRKLDTPVRDLHREQFNHLSRAQLRDLTRLLKKLRAR